jgi:hypothetical protein
MKYLKSRRSLLFGLMSRCCDAVVYKITAPITARMSSGKVGTTARKADFHAPIWSVAPIVQIVSWPETNGQPVMPSDVLSPIDIWRKPPNMTLIKKSVNTIVVIFFIMQTYVNSTPNFCKR